MIDRRHVLIGGVAAGLFGEAASGAMRYDAVIAPVARAATCQPGAASPISARRWRPRRGEVGIASGWRAANGAVSM